jgi:hypothetical protein
VNGNASDFTDIVVTFNCNAITVGGAGHDHMLMSIHLGHCDLEAEVLASLCAWLNGLNFAMCVYKWHNVMHVCFARELAVLKWNDLIMTYYIVQICFLYLCLLKAAGSIWVKWLISYANTPYVFFLLGRALRSRKDFVLSHSGGEDRWCLQIVCKIPFESEFIEKNNLQILFKLFENSVFLKDAKFPGSPRRWHRQWGRQKQQSSCWQ